MHSSPAKRAHHAPAWALGLLCVSVLFAAWPRPAAAEVLEGVSGAVVRVNVRDGAVTIRTWDRDAVEVDGDPSIVVNRRPVGPFMQFNSLPIPALGNAGTEQFLPSESFVTGAASPREAIVVRGENATGPVTVTIPNDTPLVFALARNATLDVRGYRGGTLIAFGGPKRITLDNVSGTAFVETGRGPIVAEDSSFDRIRARSLAGNITFERCMSRQIESTSIAGSIVYDGGSFQSGLARFESYRGNVAIGSDGPASVSGRATGGRIYTNFQRQVQLEGREGATEATVAGGGPVVNATSQTGNVYLYDGSLLARPLPAEWQAPAQTLRRPAMARENVAPPRQEPAPQQKPLKNRGKFRWWTPRRDRFQ